MLFFSFYGSPQFSRYIDSLRAGRSGDRIPVRGGIFRTRPDRPWVLPSLLYNGYRVFPRGVKWKGRGADHPHPSKRRGHERVGLYLYSPSGPQWTCRKNLYLYLLFFLSTFINVSQQQKRYGIQLTNCMLLYLRYLQQLYILFMSFYI